MTNSEFLERLFSIDDDTPKKELLLLCYGEAHRGLGTRPWWPSFVEIITEGSPPAHWRGNQSRVAAWQTASTRLAELRAEFEASRQ